MTQPERQETPHHRPHRAIRARRLLHGACMLAVLGFGADAHAGQTTPDAATPGNAAPGMTSGGDIVVTATKRGAASLKDVPLAVSAFSAATLANRGAIDFNGFYHDVPGLSVQDYGPGDKRYIIRGVNATGAGTVGLYLDEMITTGANASDGGGQQSDVKLFDIDRVEVLKGPQGTTFGSSSLAGTIRYITVQPDLDKVAGAINGGPRITQGADLGFQANAAINLPIMAGRLAVRVSGDYENIPGYIDNIFGKGVNNELSKAGRVIARLAATDTLTISATAMVQDTRQDSKGYINAVDYGGNDLTHFGYFQADQARAPWHDTMRLYNAVMEWKQDFGILTATASRFDRKYVFAMDASLGADAFYGLAYDGAGRSVIEEPSHRVVDSAEARFASHFGGRLQVLAGLFYQHEQRQTGDNWVTVNPQGYPYAGSQTLLNDSTDTRITQGALFGELTYALTDQLKLTTAARWFRIRIAQDTLSNIVDGQPGHGAGDALATRDGGVIGRFNLAYRVNGQVNIYAQAAQGYRSGGTNDALIAAAVGVKIPRAFNSDRLWNYEVGAKAELFGHMLYLDAALYYIDWANIQIKSQATNGTLSFAYTQNGGGAHVTGLEMQAQLRPASGMSINGSLSYSHARLSQDNPAGNAGVRGDTIPYVPRWQFSLGVDEERSLGHDGLKGLIGFDVNYTGHRATDFDAAAGPTYYPLAPYALANARIGIRRAGWSVIANVKNLFNNTAAIDYAMIVPGLYPDGRFINTPRTFMLNLGHTF